MSSLTSMFNKMSIMECDEKTKNQLRLGCYVNMSKENWVDDVYQESIKKVFDTNFGVDPITILENSVGESKMMAHCLILLEENRLKNEDDSNQVNDYTSEGEVDSDLSSDYITAEEEDPDLSIVLIHDDSSDLSDSTLPL